MKILENLELAEVEYTNDNKKVTLTFIDTEHGEVREVTFNKQSYDSGSQKFRDDPEKEVKTEERVQELFGCAFSELESCVGMRRDVYDYEKFNSLYEIDVVEKFSDDMEGEVIDVNIKEIIVDQLFIKIRYDYEGKTYESKQTLGKYMEGMKQWFVDPQKTAKEYQKFFDKFGVRVEEASILVGLPIRVTIKKAFGKFIYGEIAKVPASAIKQHLGK